MSQCTLYLAIPGPAILKSRLEALLPGFSLEGDPLSGSMSLSGEGAALSLYLRGTGIDADTFHSSMMEMYKYYESIQSDRPEIKEGLLRHLPMINASLGVVSEGEMTERIFSALQTLVDELGGLMLLPPANLYNGKGELVFDVDGRSDLAVYTITKAVNAFEESLLSTPASEARKARSGKLLAAQGVPVNQSLPPIADEENTRFRSKDELIDRLLALTLVTVYAEFARDKGVEEARAFLGWFNERYAAGALLSPKEKALVESDQPDPQAIIDTIWRYECLWVAAWALGLVPDLLYPGGICDVGSLTGMIGGFKSRDEILKRGKMRSPSEILDQADLIYRYDWACIDAMIKQQPSPAGLNGEVVQERHYFLNWLVRYGDADWDDIRTDT